MMEVDRATPTPGEQKVSWFEFLLDESLLEKHLNSESPDPSACELVSLFLYQADVTALTAKEISNREAQDGLDASQDGANGLESRKVRGLRHLALRVACHLKWNLATLSDSVPLAMVQSLLLEFLKVTSPEEDLTLKHPSQLDMGSLASQALFALLLYHRWCLRTAVRESFPTRPSKVPNVQVPGILDPSVLSSNMKEAVLQSVREGLEDSVRVLEMYVSQSRDASLPQPQSIGAIVHGDVVGHDWSLVHTVSGREMSAQIFFDLGCYYFHQQIYPKALQAFVETHSSLKQVKQLVFCQVSSQQLQGYLTACQGVVQGVPLQDQLPPSELQTISLLYQAEQSAKHGFKEINDILLQDNKKQELSLQYRAHLLQAVQNSDSPLYGEVVILNAVRLAVEGHTVHSGLITVLRGDPAALNSLIKIVEDVIPAVGHEQKVNLRALVRFIHEHLAKDTPNLTQKILSSKIGTLFASGSDLGSSVSDPSSKFMLQTEMPSPDEKDISSLEQQLLTSYDPSTIKNLVQKLHPKIGKVPTMQLSDQWQVPRDLFKAIDNLPLPNPTIQVYVFILIAKTRLCLRLLHFEKARELLSAADVAVKDVSYKLSKQLRWEVLRADLCQFTSADPSCDDIGQNDLLKRTRACIGAKESDAQPGAEILSMGCSYLLNCKDWDFLASLTPRGNPYAELGFLIASVCKELPVVRNARKPGRDLWEVVVAMFTSPAQVKRNASGAGREVHQEPIQGLLPPSTLISLLLQLKDPTVLSALLSCLAKLLSISKGLPVEIFSELQQLWPTVVSHPEALNGESIHSAAVQLMDHALSICPTNTVWLHTRADIYFADAQHTSALKYYLLMGQILTDSFSEPIMKNVFDDSVYQRLIKCCSSLKCYTYVAVLCQCLDEVDYTQAFRALQEPLTNDAMDSCYPFLWDVSILEFLIYHHTKLGEIGKRNLVIKLMGQLELNSSNPQEIQQEAARLRKAAFFRSLVSLYV